MEALELLRAAGISVPEEDFFDAMAPLEDWRAMAGAMAQLARSEDPLVRDLFPAWELAVRGWSQKHRTDWPRRWQAAGEAVGWKGACKDRMVALKDSPVWQALGDGAGGFRDTLGNPYPPFAFGSSYGWRDVTHREAQALGLLPAARL